MSSLKFKVLVLQLLSQILKNQITEVYIDLREYPHSKLLKEVDNYIKDAESLIDQEKEK